MQLLRPRHAYTLVEMLVAVAIVALVLLVVVTNVDDISPGARLASGAREVGAAIRHAGSEATSSGKAHWITYDLDHDEYWVVIPMSEEEEKRFGKGKGSVREDDSRRRRFIRGLPDGVRFKDLVVGEADVREKKEHKLEFSPLGIAPAHTIHLQYKENDDLQMTISVNLVTGEPWIREGYLAPLEFVKPEAP